jgi:hypothetical protein
MARRDTEHIRGSVLPGRGHRSDAAVRPELGRSIATRSVQHPSDQFGKVAGHQARLVAERSGSAVDVSSESGRFERWYTAGEQSADDAGQYVARTGGGQ